MVEWQCHFLISKAPGALIRKNTVSEIVSGNDVEKRVKPTEPTQLDNLTSDLKLLVNLC